MRKVVFSALFLSSLATFLWPHPGQAQIETECDPFVAQCTTPWDETPFPCYSDTRAAPFVGEACSTPGFRTSHKCADVEAREFCCECVDNNHLLLYRVGIPPGKAEPIVTIQSALGLQSVSVYSSQNVLIGIPSFEPGIVVPILVTVHKIDPLKPASFKLRACDSSQCLVFDPVYTVVVRDAGKPAEQRFADLPFEESKVSLHNHTPGVKHLEIEVNGTRLKVHDLQEGETRNLDIASAMLPGEQNEIALKAFGKPGGSITVVIHD